MNVPEIIEKLANVVTITDVLFAIGLILLASWLLKTSLGRKALADSAPRRNNMPFYLPFIALFIWFGVISLAISMAEVAKKITPDLPDWQVALLKHIFLCIGGAGVMMAIIFIVRAHFARGLKGLGLNPKTIHKDFLTGILNLLSVWPVMMGAIVLTIQVGKIIWGQDFHIERHEELKIITANPQVPLRILIFVVTIVVAPVVEEMLFRGLLQTMIRSFLASSWTSRPWASRPWASIAITSGLFAAVHANPGHWPALFALSMCLGYSYEKSGSLFRPIFIHSLFNTVSIVTVLYAT